jgi:hypothetical protein
LIEDDEIVRLNDPKFITPSVGLSTGISSQSETVGVLVESSASDPLCKLIKIYDDDESPEVSLGTPVHIEEEKGPEKTSSSIPDNQIQEVPQKEKESKSVLDTKLPDAPKTQVDNPKGKPGSDEMMEGAPQGKLVSQ